MTDDKRVGAILGDHLGDKIDEAGVEGFQDAVRLIAHAIHQVHIKYGMEMVLGAMAYCMVSLAKCEDEPEVAMAEWIAYLKRLFSTLKTVVDFGIKK